MAKLIFKLIPKTLALMAVHKQMAASRSISPAIRLQHGCVGGFPMMIPSKSPSKFTQTPSWSASLGQVGFIGGLGGFIVGGVGGFVVGGVGGFVVGGKGGFVVGGKGGYVDDGGL
ncbi:hypothetical protein L6452_31457 [Arctium lappa]|uniref:Uncharacterized protein n=1 Tax=Arctium lappa TaxID=4217 RepID=A0ACB8Z1U0_ARCLA|nr:hypothetical protein L6452_31457 [Arctium lappa]